MKYKKYFRKTSLKQDGVGDYFLNIVKEKSITILTHIPTEELIYNKISIKELFKSTYDKMSPEQKNNILQIITNNFKSVFHINYPNETSNIIMTIKPKINPNVAMSVFPPL